MNAALQELLEQLDLEKIEENIFRGYSPVERETRVFGGHVMAQALMAGSRPVGDDRLCHSFHAYFLLGGDPKAPIVYEAVSYTHLDVYKRQAPDHLGIMPCRRGGCAGRFRA